MYDRNDHHPLTSFVEPESIKEENEEEEDEEATYMEEEQRSSMHDSALALRQRLSAAEIGTV